jgi:HD-GYP domain-containing protein (c-di-GMP phosphodiesterase class II)
MGRLNSRNNALSKSGDSLLESHIIKIEQRRRRGKKRMVEGEDLYNNLIEMWKTYSYKKGEKGAIELAERIKPHIPSFIASLKMDREMMKMVVFGEEPEFYLPAHGVNVAVLGIGVARGMGYSDDELQRVALTAFLHDVGMKEMPSQIWTKKETLTPDERDVIRRHPLAGYELLKPIDEVAKVIVQEHERMNGTGYPQGSSGGDIHEFAYIIGIADIYNSLTHIRPYREKRYSSFEATREIVIKERDRFPSSVLKSLIASFLLPAGSRVELNSGEKAEVVEGKMASPMRPVVKITHDKNNREYDKPKILDLDRDQRFFIVEYQLAGGAGLD